MWCLPNKDLEKSYSGSLCSSLTRRIRRMSSGSDGSASTETSPRREGTPEYIPHLADNLLLCRPTTIPAGGNTLWGKARVRAMKSADNVITGETEHMDKKRLHDADSDTEDESPIARRLDGELPKKNSTGLMDLPKIAQLFINSKKAARRAKRRIKLLRRTKDRDDEELDEYNLRAVYEKIQRQKQVVLALMQQPFLRDRRYSLSIWDKSVKMHLKQKADILKKIKEKTFIASDTKIEYSDQQQPQTNRRLVRRQSRLRHSVDLSNAPLPLALPVKFKVPITAADLERELAITLSRERIEEQLNLPENRMKRLTMLRSNVNKVNIKFMKFVRGSKGASDAGDPDLAEKLLYYQASRFVQPGMALELFRKYAKIVLIILQWISMITNNQYNFERQLKSFVDIAHDIDDSTKSTNMADSGLSFDRKYFKANTEISLSQEARKILTTRWQSRTPEMVRQVMNGLQSLRSLSEYPVTTQQKLCKVAWYQTIGPKKVIVRQGHHAESFYFILSGTAFVKKLIEDPVTGDSVNTAARLTRGHSFGEIGLLFNTRRTATVESASAMELLIISKEDFVRIFMNGEDTGSEPEHLTFLRHVTFLKYWPVEVLKKEAGACLIHYFKRGSLVTDNDKHSEWLYVVMSGSCEVVKRLRSVKPRGQPKTSVNPITDVMLPELTMPNIHSRIDVGRKQNQATPMHPEILNKMTEFYDDLRQKHGAGSNVGGHIKLPERADTQSAKVFSRASSRGPDADGADRQYIQQRAEKPAGDGATESRPMTIKPLDTDNKRRPVSRSKFDSSMPKINENNFMIPTTDSLNTKHRPTGPCRPSESDRAQSKEPPSSDVFVKLDQLRVRDVFGLNTLQYVMEADDDMFRLDGNENPPVLSLVSCGSEVIMISKKIFLKYADQRCKMMVRDAIRVYPDEDVLQDTMQTEVDWSYYRQRLISQYVQQTRHKHRAQTTVSAAF